MDSKNVTMAGADCSERTIPHTQATGSVCSKVPGVTEKSYLKALSKGTIHRAQAAIWDERSHQAIEKPFEAMIV